jgi:hypothetical protein
MKGCQVVVKVKGNNRYSRGYCLPDIGIAEGLHLLKVYCKPLWKGGKSVVLREDFASLSYHMHH